MSTILDEQIAKKKEPWKLIIIPFQKWHPGFSKEDCLTLKLHSNPKRADLVTYELKTYGYDKGMSKERLEHIRSFKKILKEQHIK